MRRSKERLITPGPRSNAEVSSLASSQPDENLLCREHPNIQFTEFCKQLEGVSFEAEWVVVPSDNAIQICKMKTFPMSAPVVERSVTIHVDMSWHAYATGKLLTRANCQLLRRFPDKISEVKCLNDILKTVQTASLCPGNPDSDFVELFKCRSKSTSQAVAFTTEVVNTDGTVSPETIRHSDCDLLCAPKGKFPQRCQKCSGYRNNLRVMKCRSQNSSIEKRVAHDSHVNICFLSDDEKTQRLRNVQEEKRVLMLKNKKLQQKLQILIDKDGITLNDTESEKVFSLVEEASTEVQKFPENSFQSILWEEQLKYNALKEKRQMRWHPLVIRFALSLKYASSAAYKQVTKLGFLALPSERTLRDYTHWCPTTSGVQLHFIQQIKKLLKEESIDGDQKQFCLLVDEMKIKSGLVFSKSSGKLVGFCDLGTVNSELEEMATLASGRRTSDTQELASHMLTFVMRSVFKPSLSFMVAMYPSAYVTGEKLFPVIWEVIETLELNLLPVISITSDGASHNRRFYKLCSLDGINYKTKNPFAPDRYIYSFFCDPPHLLKTAHNCFSNSYSHLKSCKLQVSVDLVVFGMTGTDRYTQFFCVVIFLSKSSFYQ